MKVNRATLKYLAMLFMLVDHMWATIIPDNFWMTCVGRLAFPIFAFQLVEGFQYTKDLKAYKKRLFCFALISEIPFDLMSENVLFYPYHQNVMFTMLIGIFALESVKKIETVCAKTKNKTMKINESISCMMTQIGIIIIYYVVATVGTVDYSIYGITTILLFYIFRNNKIAQLSSMIVLYGLLFEGQEIELFNSGFFIPLQSLCILSLPLIWFYDRKATIRNNNFTKQLGYWFYPAHLLILWIISVIINIVK